MDGSSTDALVASILNAAWMVRHHARGGRVSADSPMAAKRQEAIRAMGVIVRDAFQSSEDFEALLAAVVDGLRPREEPPF